jgi:hypothetical protein
MNLTDPLRPILFALPYEISQEDQHIILEYAYTHAGSWSGQVQVWNQITDRHENTDYFGRLQITKLTQCSRAKMGEGYNSDWVNWAARLDPDLDWEWIETPITSLVRGYVDKIRHLYRSFHRVLILVQRQRSVIPMHTDKVVRNTYQDEIFTPGPSASLPLKDSDLHWQHNRYLALKWPLTEIPGNNGEPLIEIDRRVFRYDVGRHCFAINEVDVKHGAGSVNHRRGVIFLDGVLDYDILAKETWLPVQLSAHRYDP